MTFVSNYFTMDANFIHQDSLTFIFSIPHVSHLLVYKDHWNESRVMRTVIAEVIDNKLFSKIYLGSHPKKLDEETLSSFEDTAIISLRINGLQSRDPDFSNPESLFSAELRNKNNVMHFDNSSCCTDKNVSAIDISIRLYESFKNHEEDYSAA